MIEDRVRELLKYYEATNAMFMRLFESNGHWSDAASEGRRFQTQLEYVLRDEDPLQDQRPSREDE